jgi:RHS repeat-associated protein
LASGNPQLLQAAYQWSGTASNWTVVDSGVTLSAGTVLWLNAATNAVLTVLGTYVEPTNSVLAAGSTFLPAAGLQAWNLTNGLPANLIAWLRSSPAGSNPWLIRATPALGPLPGWPGSLSPGQVLFVQSSTNALVQPPDPASRINYYHQDHLGSSSVITDANGMLVEETAFYPSGTPRNQYQPRAVREPYQFAQKERDAETGLWHFQARYLASQLSRFISVDPNYASPENLPGQSGRDFLAQPQLHNPYAFAECNPLKYTDADGLEVVWSDSLQKNKQFQRALKILKSSEEGQRILAALKDETVSADIGKGEAEDVAGVAHKRIEYYGSGSRTRRLVTVKIDIDMDMAKKRHFTDYELANIIHHELRHAEIATEKLAGEDLSTEESVQKWEAKRKKKDNALDVYLRSDLPTKKGTGIQTLDERNHEFQVEIGLRRSQEEEDKIHEEKLEKLKKYEEQIKARAKKQQ